MTKDQAFEAAQTRANFSKKTMVVYRLQGATRDLYHVTADRVDLPDEWIVVGYVSPEIKTNG